MTNKLNRGLIFLSKNLPIHLILLFTSLLPNSSFTIRVRGTLLRPFFKKCGKGFKIASGVVINRPENLVIGDNVYLAHNVWINATGGLTIGDNVAIGPMCVLATSNHIIKDGMLTNHSESAPIFIKHGCWLSSHVVVTSGITINEGVLVAAGSVVTKNIESHNMIGGVPAKVIKRLNENND